MLFKKVSQRLPFLIRKGSLFSYIILCLLAGCDYSGLRLIDSLNIGEGAVLLAGNINKKPVFYTYDDTGLRESDLGKSVIDKMGPQKKVVKLTETVGAAITEKNGIFLLPLVQGSELSGSIQIPVNKEPLLNDPIRYIYYYSFNEVKKLYVTYDISKGSGVTEITLGNNWSIVSYNHLDTAGSELRDNRVIQIETDTHGNVWFNYSYKAKKGVSRLNPQGEWSHFDRNNSELPDKSIFLIRAEKKDMGLKNDNVWFASKSGLTRLEYRDTEKDEEKRERWKLYGEKETSAGIVTRALGISEYFSDAILDIIDIYVTENNLLLANNKGVYIFNGKSSNRFIPDALGGMAENYIERIIFRDRYVIVKISPRAMQGQGVNSIVMLDLKLRKWFKIDIWAVSNQFPDQVYFIPFKKDMDFALLKYQSGPSICAFLDYSSKKFTKITLPKNIPLPEKKMDKPAEEQAPKTSEAVPGTPASEEVIPAEKPAENKENKTE